MSELEDIKLKALLNEMKLDSPEANFTVRVMNKIFEEDSVLEKIKSQKVLGKGFWMITILFSVLLVSVLILNNTGTPAESQINNLLGIDSGTSIGYQGIFETIGTIPLSIAGMLLASSILLFLDRFISSNSKLFT